MRSDFIQPMQVLPSIKSMNTENKVDENGSQIFASILENALGDVKTTQAELEEQQYLLATGNIDDAHTIPIAAAEAQLAVDMLVQLRNKAVDAYNELLKTNV